MKTDLGGRSATIVPNATLDTSTQVSFSSSIVGTASLLAGSNPVYSFTRNNSYSFLLNRGTNTDCPSSGSIGQLLTGSNSLQKDICVGPHPSFFTQTNDGARPAGNSRVGCSVPEIGLRGGLRTHRVSLLHQSRVHASRQPAARRRWSDPPYSSSHRPRPLRRGLPDAQRLGPAPGVAGSGPARRSRRGAFGVRARHYARARARDGRVRHALTRLADDSLSNVGGKAIRLQPFDVLSCPITRNGRLSEAASPDGDHSMRDVPCRIDAEDLAGKELDEKHGAAGTWH